MSLTALFATDRKKNDEFVLGQAQQLVSALTRRPNRPLHASESAVFERVLKIADHQIRRSNRFKRKRRKMARRVVKLVVDNEYVQFPECIGTDNQYTHEVTERGKQFMRSRSWSNHPSNSIPIEATEAAA